MVIRWIKKQWQNRVELLQWQKGSLLAARSEPNEALKIFENFNFSDGPKQIVLIQSANIKFGLGCNNEALELYQKSIKSENAWGQRKKPNDSKYIIEYAKLYADVQELLIEGKSNQSFEWTIPRINKLKNMDVSSRLKKYFLPLP